MLANCSLKEAMARHKLGNKRWFLGTKTRDLRILLNFLHVTCCQNRLYPVGKRSLYDFKGTYILKLVKWLGDVGYASSWHWIVLHKGKIYDPAQSKPFPIEDYFDYYAKNDVVTSYFEVWYESKKKTR